MQEALSNVVRHARAQTASVAVSLNSTPAFVTVMDDGAGFPVPGRFELAELKARNWGPVSIRERVAALRGNMVLTSSSSGTTVEIELPVERSAFANSASRPGARHD